MSHKEVLVWTENGQLTGRLFDGPDAVDDFIYGWSEPVTSPIWNLVWGRQWYTNKDNDRELIQPTEDMECLFTASAEDVPPEVRALALLLS